MAEMKGTVTTLDGDHAWVRIPEEGCGRCQEPGGCGGGHLARAFCAPSRVYRVRNPSGARLGEEVTVMVRDRTLFRGAVAGYVLPLLGLFLGAALGREFAGETGSMAGAAAGLATAWGIQRMQQVQHFLLGPDPEPCIKQANTSQARDHSR
jgi:sigma-E factor negative regulatory protein RseC